MLQEIVFSVGGYGVILIALISWLASICSVRIQQKESTKLKELLDLKISEFQANLETKSHISKVQYESEFVKYQQIWELASSISNDVERYKGDYVDSISFLNKVQAQLEVRHRKMVDFSNAQYPFIDETVFDSFNVCCKAIEYFRQQLLVLIKISEASELSQSRVFEELDIFCKSYMKFGQDLAISIKERNSSILVVKS